MTPSLVVIDKELKRINASPNKEFDIKQYDWIPLDNLYNWVEQGVLLLNTALTVERGKPGSHIEYWKAFTKEILTSLNDKPRIFMLWGSHAKSWTSILDDKHYILEAVHPVYESRNPKASIKFTGCNHFLDANNILLSRGKEEIDWYKAYLPF